MAALWQPSPEHFIHITAFGLVRGRPEKVVLAQVERFCRQVGNLVAVRAVLVDSAYLKIDGWIPESRRDHLSMMKIRHAIYGALTVLDELVWSKEK